MDKLFHVPPRYFLSHSVGCLPKGSENHLKEQYFDPWRHKGGAAWPIWLSVLDEYRSYIGGILKAPSDCICPQTNVSSALTKIIHSLPRQPSRNVILLSPKDFPTNGFVIKLAEAAGYRLKFLNGSITDPRVWENSIDSHTAIVHITHALSNSSQLLPVKEICQSARKHGAISIVDVAQSVGAVKIDVEKWGADFAIGTGVKFLCCGPGACFLYASKPMLEYCAPIDVGWFSHEHPFEMNIREFRYAKSAMMYFGGTPSPAPFILANASLKLWQDIGHDTVFEKIQTALSRLIHQVPDTILRSPNNIKDRGATLVIDPPDREKITEVLNKNNILHDQRKEGFRFSVHAYTRPEDLNALADVFSKM